MSGQIAQHQLHHTNNEETTSAQQQAQTKAKNNKYQAKFQKDHTFDVRSQESTKILAKYPDRIPLIVEKTPGNNVLPQISKSKFLVPSDITITQFMFIIRKYLKLDPSVSIYLFCDGVIPNAGESINNVYINHKDADGFLYLFYAGENTFG
jgi:GABA(A) receptor-associated protein